VIFAATTAFSYTSTVPVTFRAGASKSVAPSGSIDVRCNGATVTAVSDLTIRSGDNIRGLTTSAVSQTGTIINNFGLRGGVLYRSTTVGPTQRSITISASATHSVTGGTWVSFRQHSRLRFYEACDASNTGTRTAVAVSAAAAIGDQSNSIANPCSCAGGHCTCPWEQSVANQIYWALADYGLIRDLTQIPK